MKTKYVWWLGSEAPKDYLEMWKELPHLSLSPLSLIVTRSLQKDEPCSLSNIDSIYFVSKAAVKAMVENYSITNLSKLTIIATGEATAKYIEQHYPLSVDYINPYSSAEMFFKNFNDLPLNISKLLVPISQENQGKYRGFIERYQVNVELEEEVIYQKIESIKAREDLDFFGRNYQRGDYLVVTSATSWNYFISKLSKEIRSHLFQQVQIISIGPVSSQAIREISPSGFLEANPSNYRAIFQMIMHREKEAKCQNIDEIDERD